MPREPSHRYIDLMNGRHDRIRGACWAGSTLTITYDGNQWAASVDVRPAGRGRWVTGSGATEELAVVALEEEMGLGKWDG